MCLRIVSKDLFAQCFSFYYPELLTESPRKSNLRNFEVWVILHKIKMAGSAMV